jgi:hypothetical protein
MAAKLTGLTHKIAIQLHLVAESCIICSSRFRRPVRKLLDTPSAALCKVHMALVRMNNGILVSNPTQDMCLCPRFSLLCSPAKVKAL